MRHEATKEEILAAAWELARTVGLTGFSLRDLALAVHMRHQSLYTYFPSKHAIYDALFAQGMRALVDQRARRPSIVIPSKPSGKRPGPSWLSVSRTRFATSSCSSGSYRTSCPRRRRCSCQRRLSATSRTGTVPRVSPTPPTLISGGLY